LSNPVPWQNWMVAYLGYTLRMRTLFRGWPIMVNDTHTRRRRTCRMSLMMDSYLFPVLSDSFDWVGFFWLTGKVIHPVKSLTPVIHKSLYNLRVPLGCLAWPGMFLESGIVKRWPNVIAVPLGYDFRSATEAVIHWDYTDVMLKHLNLLSSLVSSCANTQKTTAGFYLLLASSL